MSKFLLYARMGAASAKLRSPFESTQTVSRAQVVSPRVQRTAKRSPQTPSRSRSAPAGVQAMPYSLAAPRLASLKTPYWNVPSGAFVYVRAVAPVPTVNVPAVTVTVVDIVTHVGSLSSTGWVPVTQSVILRSPVLVVW